LIGKDISSMHDVKELTRHDSPAGRPQPLAFHGKVLWVGCWATSHLYALDPATWSVLDEVPAPGRPYGMASFGGALHVVVSIGEEDDRYLYRFVPGQGFDAASKAACPQLTGSHLATDGKTLYLLQMTNARILALDSERSASREIALPSRCGGIGFGFGAFYMISADEELENLKLATLDIKLDHPPLAPVAALPPEARALVSDGTAWWTSHREQSRIVSFAVAPAR
jgi:hypothetical protein